MNVQQALASTRELLAANKADPETNLIAEILLRHILRLGRAEFYLRLKEIFPPEKESQLRLLVGRALRGEPASYITNQREFYGLNFFVDARVLIPRPESELLVEEALRWMIGRPEATAADAGTGSGALAISLAVHSNAVKIYALDISPYALEVAEINCRAHQVQDRIILLQGDLLVPLLARIDLILANLPYVRREELETVPSSDFEPRLALDGGESGLEKIFELCRQAQDKLAPKGCLLLEVGLGQSQTVADYLSKLYPSAKIQVIPDLSGIDRVVRMTLI